MHLLNMTDDVIRFLVDVRQVLKHNQQSRFSFVNFKNKATFSSVFDEVKCLRRPSTADLDPSVFGVYTAALHDSLVL